MDGIWLFAVVLLAPLFSVVLHELTHLLAARLVSPISVTCLSYFPLRVEIDLHTDVSRHTVRVIALAPSLVAGVLAVVAFHSGLWQDLRYADPYFLHYLIGLNWLLYFTPSPADLRVAFSPPVPSPANEVV